MESMRNWAKAFWPAFYKALAHRFVLAKRERDGLMILLLMAGVLVFLPEWTADRRNRREARFWASLPEATLRWMDSIDRALGGNGTETDPLPDTYVGRMPRRSAPAPKHREEGQRPAAPAADQQNPAPPAQEEGTRQGKGTPGPSRRNGTGRAEDQQRIRRKADPSDPSTWRPYAGPLVDINRADEAAFDALPGIGASMARRAVRFRESLGGFCNVEQFAELWGLDAEVFAFLQPHLRCSAQRNMLVLNRSPADTLKAHPYIAPWIADRIVDYRQEHGAFLNLEEVQRVRGVTDSLFERLKPYLKLGAPVGQP